MKILLIIFLLLFSLGCHKRVSPPVSGHSLPPGDCYICDNTTGKWECVVSHKCAIPVYEN
jgi:hypothetical protein